MNGSGHDQKLKWGMGKIRFRLGDITGRAKAIEPSMAWSCPPSANDTLGMGSGEVFKARYSWLMEADCLCSMVADMSPLAGAERM